MIKSAFGDELDFKSQSEIQIHGHAIECRICAEDPITMLPAPGKIAGFETTFPQGIRFDHCLYQNFEITSDFDPMIGKLIARGSSRAVAMRKTRAALNGLLLDGLKTNIPLLKVILSEESFIAGKYTTHYIQSVKPQDQVAVVESEMKLLEKVVSMEMGAL
jgi:acetyl-CoA carboxylase biotin carboxylase subunit